MITKSVVSPYFINQEKRILQGDILKDISFFVGIPEDTQNAEVIDIPYGVVVSQDCDLSEDYNSCINTENNNNDKELKTILICPCYNLESFVNGEQIDGKNMRKFSSKEIKKISRNDEFKRYHYLPASDNLPELVIDFKHFHSVHRDILYHEGSKKNNLYKSTLRELFRENMSQRFANFLNRIGLPEITQIEV